MAEEPRCQKTIKKVKKIDVKLGSREKAAACKTSKKQPFISYLPANNITKRDIFRTFRSLVSRDRVALRSWTIYLELACSGIWAVFRKALNSSDCFSLRQSDSIGD